MFLDLLASALDLHCFLNMNAHKNVCRSKLHHINTYEFLRYFDIKVRHAFHYFLKKIHI